MNTDFNTRYLEVEFVPHHMKYLFDVCREHLKIYKQNLMGLTSDIFMNSLVGLILHKET